ncbi:hypothetical protein [Nostoc sp. 'Peltigera membranacea cyanobiont' 232]|uniref:hypothetical protein n=1 Tax=Nostoc sp. 'Peltigera membranacea cyanobiont' 232 TaxID=2014531 RepID=UPI000B954FE7|nr:hypothetical protein [Nostoc sp. 'Peltigera membranacea cyanobiont' 232]OYD99862.1 hypothetical protein CDG79_38440 [Nostoc sp. 'Peltigera membranacea cyanobiont' 232]
MTKSKISSKVVRARSLAIYELEKFIGYIGTIDPELTPDKTIVLAASLLAGMPALFEENPAMLNHVKEMAASIKLKPHPLN